jgi:hypothetical protein
VAIEPLLSLLLCNLVHAGASKTLHSPALSLHQCRQDACNGWLHLLLQTGTPQEVVGGK